MNIRDVFRFRRHRRVIGGMRDAAIGHATTVYGAVVTLAAFYTLWIVILHCEEENQPHRIFTRYMEKATKSLHNLMPIATAAVFFPKALKASVCANPDGEMTFTTMRRNIPDTVSYSNISG